MNRLKRLGMVAGVSIILAGTVTPMTISQVSAKTEVVRISSSGRKMKKTTWHVKSSRFMHCTPDQYVKYVKKLNILKKDELEVLVKTEKKLAKLYQRMNENTDQWKVSSGKKQKKLENEYDQMSKEVDKLLDGNQYMYEKITASIPKSVYAINADGEGVSQKEYQKAHASKRKII